MDFGGVRLVVVFRPIGIVDVYQQFGRAGRDGSPATVILVTMRPIGGGTLGGGGGGLDKDVEDYVSAKCRRAAVSAFLDGTAKECGFADVPCDRCGSSAARGLLATNHIETPIPGTSTTAPETPTMGAATPSSYAGSVRATPNVNITPEGRQLPYGQSPAPHGGFAVPARRGVNITTPTPAGREGANRFSPYAAAAAARTQAQAQAQQRRTPSAYHSPAAAAAAPVRRQPPPWQNPATPRPTGNLAAQYQPPNRQVDSGGFHAPASSRSSSSFLQTQQAHDDMMRHRSGMVGQVVEATGYLHEFLRKNSASKACMNCLIVGSHEEHYFTMCPDPAAGGLLNRVRDATNPGRGNGGMSFKSMSCCFSCLIPQAWDEGKWRSDPLSFGDRRFTQIPNGKCSQKLLYLELIACVVHNHIELVDEAIQELGGPAPLTSELQFGILGSTDRREGMTVGKWLRDGYELPDRTQTNNTLCVVALAMYKLHKNGKLP